MAIANALKLSGKKKKKSVKKKKKKALITLPPALPGPADP